MVIFEMIDKMNKTSARPTESEKKNKLIRNDSITKSVKYKGS